MPKKGSEGFQLELAQELEEIMDLLREKDIQVIIGHSFSETIKKLKNGTSGTLTEWRCSISDLQIDLNHATLHTYPQVDKVRLIIKSEVEGKLDCWNTTQDPFTNLNFSISIHGYGGDGQLSCIRAYHLDREVPKDEHREVHPLYHFQLGGTTLRKREEVIQSNLDFGATLLMDNPRIVHYPLDFILGLDFILANYLYPKWLELRNDNTYRQICKKHQHAIWKPYVHTLAKQLGLNVGPSSWTTAPNFVWPNLL